MPARGPDASPQMRDTWTETQTETQAEDQAAETLPEIPSLRGLSTIQLEAEMNRLEVQFRQDHESNARAQNINLGSREAHKNDVPKSFRLITILQDAEGEEIDRWEAHEVNGSGLHPTAMRHANAVAGHKENKALKREWSTLKAEARRLTDDQRRLGERYVSDRNKIYTAMDEAARAETSAKLANPRTSEVGREIMDRTTTPKDDAFTRSQNALDNMGIARPSTPTPSKAKRAILDGPAAHVADAAGLSDA